MNKSRKKRRRCFKKRQKRNQKANYGFDPDELDFGDDEDEEMKTSEKGDDEETAMDVDVDAKG